VSKPVVYRKQPMPNDLIDGGTVIASVVMNDDDLETTWWVLLLLRRSAPFYEVLEVHADGTKITLSEAENIIPAAETYADMTGGY
jgi:hypothetical protein